MSNDIQTQISNSYLWSSDIVLSKIYKNTFDYDKHIIQQEQVVTLNYLNGFHQNKACININNDDNTCFKYCVQCSVFNIYEKDNPEIIRHYNKLNDAIINWGCMKFPCSRKYIDRFEEDNQGLISVNVYKLLNETTITYRITKVKHAEHHINLLMIEQ